MRLPSYLQADVVCWKCRVFYLILFNEVGFFLQRVLVLLVDIRAQYLPAAAGLRLISAVNILIVSLGK